MQLGDSKQAVWALQCQDWMQSLIPASHMLDGPASSLGREMGIRHPRPKCLGAEDCHLVLRVKPAKTVPSSSGHLRQLCDLCFPEFLPCCGQTDGHFDSSLLHFSPHPASASHRPTDLGCSTHGIVTALALSGGLATWGPRSHHGGGFLYVATPAAKWSFSENPAYFLFYGTKQTTTVQDLKCV